MAFKEFTFDSANGRDKECAWIHFPMCRPKGVVHIVHGYGEHFRRFLAMTGVFNDAGFVVCGGDHVGFGKTAEINDTWGDPGEGGWRMIVEDEKRIHDTTVRELGEDADIPYFMFGFSYGSAIVRASAAVYPEELKGILMDGPLCRWEQVDKILADGAFEQEILDGKGADPDNCTWAYKMLVEDMCARREEEDESLAWLCRDKGLLKDNLEDPLDMGEHIPQKRLLWNLCDIYRFVNSDACIEALRKDLAVYIFGGGEDPCGGYGEGAFEIAKHMRSCGIQDVQVEIFDDYCHEVHNEPDIKYTVYKKMLDFMEARL